jgi:hypothetical protein
MGRKSGSYVMGRHGHVPPIQPPSHRPRGFSPGPRIKPFAVPNDRRNTCMEDVVYKSAHRTSSLVVAAHSITRITRSRYAEEDLRLMSNIVCSVRRLSWWRKSRRIPIWGAKWRRRFSRACVCRTRQRCSQVGVMSCTVSSIVYGAPHVSSSAWQCRKNPESRVSP